MLVFKETNNFEVKKILFHDDMMSNYFVYNSFDTNMEEDWLLNVKLYSEKFKAN